MSPWSVLMIPARDSPSVLVAIKLNDRFGIVNNGLIFWVQKYDFSQNNALSLQFRQWYSLCCKFLKIFFIGYIRTN